MSLIVAIKGPEGIVLASDSRRVLYAGDPRELTSPGTRQYMTWDGDMKLVSLRGEAHRWIGITAYGVWRASETMTLLVAEIEAGLPARRLAVREYAERVRTVLVRWSERPMRSPFSMQAIVAGFDEGEAEGRVFLVDVPANLEPIELHPGAVGIASGGMREFIDRLLLGYDSLLSVEDEDLRSGLQTPLPLSTMSLEESVELATFLIRTTMSLQRFAGRLGLQGAGGPVDVATITAADGLRYVQRKTFDPQSPVTEHEFTSDRPAIITDAPADIVRLASYTVRSDLRPRPA